MANGMGKKAGKQESEKARKQESEQVEELKIVGSTMYEVLRTIRRLRLIAAHVSFQPRKHSSLRIGSSQAVSYKGSYSYVWADMT